MKVRLEVKATHYEEIKKELEKCGIIVDDDAELLFIWSIKVHRIMICIQ